MGSLKGKFNYETTVAPEVNSKITFGEAAKAGALTAGVTFAVVTTGKYVGGKVKGFLEKFF
jgi:hypothetical protein